MLGLLAAACVAAEASPDSGAAPTLSPQAAALALAAFDHDNPACRMWTDWQSLCSRTGAGMSTYCKQDGGFAAKPSAPFCVSRQVPPGTTNQAMFDTPVQRQSRNRFCELFVGDAGSMRGPAGPMPECKLYALQRPFDGRRPQAIAHPLCKEWRQVTPDSAVVPGPAACVAWRDPLPCPKVIGNAYLYPNDSSAVVLSSVRNARSQAAWGVYCIEGG